MVLNLTIHSAEWNLRSTIKKPCITHLPFPLNLPWEAVEPFKEISLLTPVGECLRFAPLFSYNNSSHEFKAHSKSRWSHFKFLNKSASTPCLNRVPFLGPGSEDLDIPSSRCHTFFQLVPPLWQIHSAHGRPVFDLRPDLLCPPESWGIHNVSLGLDWHCRRWSAGSPLSQPLAEVDTIGTRQNGNRDIVGGNLCFGWKLKGLGSTKTWRNV